MPSLLTMLSALHSTISQYYSFLDINPHDTCSPCPLLVLNKGSLDMEGRQFKFFTALVPHAIVVSMPVRPCLPLLQTSPAQFHPLPPRASPVRSTYPDEIACATSRQKCGSLVRAYVHGLCERTSQRPSSRCPLAQRCMACAEWARGCPQK